MPCIFEASADLSSAFEGNLPLFSVSAVKNCNSHNRISAPIFFIFPEKGTGK
jgi:hypothetical protein